MNSPHALPQRAINPPEFPDWTKADIDQAIENLEYHILFEDKPWDENCQGWRGDLHVDLEELAFLLVRGKIDSDELIARLREKTFDAVRRHAEEEVMHDPNKYCEEVD